MRAIALVLVVLWAAPSWAGRTAGAAEGPLRAANELVPVEVQRIVLVNQHPAVVLKSVKEPLFLVVYIDQFMAQAIQMGMLGLSIERPMTHDLIGILLNRLGAKVNKISITELKSSTYFALISLRMNGTTQEIDARPSDALAIAVRTKAPVFVARGLLSDTMFPEGGAPGEVTPEGPAGPKHGA